MSHCVYGTWKGERNCGKMELSPGYNHEIEN